MTQSLKKMEGDTHRVRLLADTYIGYLRRIDPPPLPNVLG